MAHLSQNRRIILALLLSAGLVAGAYYIARGVSHPPVAVASTETALLQAIATRDADGDGLPNWEEALYGTDPDLIDTRRLGMTDGEAVAKGLIVPKAVADLPTPGVVGGQSEKVDGIGAPGAGTLTDSFARKFFTLFLDAKQAKGGNLTEADTNAIVQQAVQELANSVAPSPDFKSMRDLTVSGSGPDALRAFAISAEAVLLQHRAQVSKGELLYLQDVVQNNDESALVNIVSIAKGYRETAAALAVLSAPQELANDYLALINAFARVGEIAGDFARVNIDPLTTILALSQYPNIVMTLGNALIGINKVYVATDVIFTSGTPGASFVNIIPDIAEKQRVEAEKAKP